MPRSFSRREVLKILSSLGTAAFCPSLLTFEPSRPVELVTFGRVIHDRAPLYRLINNKYVEFSPARNVYLYKNSLQRLRYLDNGMVQIIGDPGPMEGTQGYSPWNAFQKIREVFAHQTDFEELIIKEPVNVYPDTKPAEKMVIIMQSSSPHIILFEGSAIVAKIPVSLGRIENGKSLTPLGFFHIMMGYVSRNMGEYAGVAFPLFLGNLDNTTNGEAFHEAYWLNFDQENREEYVSHGCINEPPPSKYDITWNNIRQSFGEWFSRWVRTNLLFDSYTQEGQTVPQLDWCGQDNWYQGTKTMRIISVKTIDELVFYPNSDGLYNWQKQIAAYQALTTQVRIPALSNGQLSFTDAAYDQVPLR